MSIVFHDASGVPERDTVPHSGNATLVPAVLQSMQADGAERRLEHRRRVLKTGRIVYHKSLGVMDAIIRDVTSNGARIKLADTMRLPEHCEFQFKDDKYRKAVRIVWKTATEAGIAFV